MFAPLHIKSEYSLGCGTTPVEALVERAKRDGCTSLALTDVESLAGQVRLHHAARAAGIQAITGVELRAGYGSGRPGNRSGRLVLLARDHTGYESLCRIIAKRRGSFDPTPDPLRCLEQNPRGVFFLSDDARVIELLLEAVAAEDVRWMWNSRTSLAPPTAQVRWVAAPEVLFLDPGDHELHGLLAAIRQGRLLGSFQNAEPPHSSLPTPEAIARVCATHPAALAESVRLAECCSLDLTRWKAPLPSFASAGEASAELELARRCRQALGSAAPERAARLERELTAISGLGYAGYFLIVAELVRHAQSRGIALAGRGSASASLVAHLLGITATDPLQHGLYFERFLHAGRRDPPDIDLDLPSDRRDELIHWTFRRFGPDHVAMVSTLQRFGRRSAYREGLKALGMSSAGAQRISAQIPDEPDSGAPLELLTESLQSKVPLLERLIGRPRHIGTHPGGIVFTGACASDQVPVELAPKGVLVTQYDRDSLERMGFVKLDLLGNRALTAIGAIERSIGSAIQAPDGDADTLELLHRADTVGCFQIETPPLRSLLRKVPVRGTEDLIATLALVRPGPASGEAKSAYVRRAHGEAAPAPPHPLLTRLLRRSYGVLLYEEDLMAATSELTGWSLSHADSLRASLIATDPGGPERNALAESFCSAASGRGLDAETARSLWSLLERFAAYSFNKAHAASYAALSWKTAFLKAHWPTEFACAVLNNYGGQYPLRSVAADFARNGVLILPPHVNYSEANHQVQSGAVRIGLHAVKYLAGRSRAAIRAARPFSDLTDFLQRVPLHRRELESLLLAGACDGLAPLVPEAYPVAHQDLLLRARNRSDPGMLRNFVVRRPSGPHAPRYRALVRARNEIRVLGMHPSAHPMQLLRDEADRIGCRGIRELPLEIGRQVRVAALVAASRKLNSAEARRMQFVTLEDEQGMIEAVLRPGVFETLDASLSDPGPLVVSGRIEADHGDLLLAVSEVSAFHERDAPYRSVAPA